MVSKNIRPVDKRIPKFVVNVLKHKIVIFFFIIRTAAVHTIISPSPYRQFNDRGTNLVLIADAARLLQLRIHIVYST